MSIFYIYFLIGFIFAIAFFALGYRKIDPAAQGAGLGLRLLWTPAAIVLWPLLSWRWIQAGNDKE